MQGNKYGSHRVLEPQGKLPQGAQKLDNDFSKLYDNEILVDVHSLNIDSASFAQLKQAAQGDPEKIKEQILKIVVDRGKMQNPVTGSGGMFIGTVAAFGSALKLKDLKIGDKIASLVSLSLTPLYIEEIKAIHPEIDRVDIKGQAVLFASGIYAKLPTDLSENLSLAALDVAGAPAQTAKLVKPGDSVLILGAGGKSGLLCLYEAKKRVGPTGNVIALDRSEKDVEKIRALGLAHQIIVADATNALEVLEKTLEANDNQEVDIAISCVNAPDAEMSCILPVRQEGIVYFFSMATSFTKAALGAEGVGKDVTMIIGNGYTKGHAEITLWELRENEELKEYFNQRYV